MSYEEKGVWVYVVVTIASFGTYLALVLPQLLTGTAAGEIDYVPAMLWTIGGAILAAVLGRVLVEMISPSESTKGDVRDKQIDRAGEQVGSALVVIGALAALVFAMLELDWFWIANVIYLCFALSGVISSLTKLAFYHRGMPEW